MDVDDVLVCPWCNDLILDGVGVPAWPDVADSTQMHPGCRTRMHDELAAPHPEA